MNTNPMFSEKALEVIPQNFENASSINGTVSKTLLLLIICVISAFATASQVALGYTDKVGFITMVGLIIGLILALVISFKPLLAKYLAPVYSFAEGVVLGSITMIFEKSFPGIAANAIGLTFITLFTMLLLYRANILKATPLFKKVVFIATLTIMIYYIIALFASFFNVVLPFSIADSSLLSIGISFVVVVVAALNFILDFDFIENGVKNALSKDYEWYFAFGLMVTLVWLYIEMLKLLAKLRQND